MSRQALDARFSNEEGCAQYLANRGWPDGVNGGVKSGHWGGAKVGQFVECALGRVATN